MIGAVLKTVERASVPWVRIPPPPDLKESVKRLFLVVNNHPERHGVILCFLAQCLGFGDLVRERCTCTLGVSSAL